MVTRLYPYQQDGAAWLQDEPYRYLGDGMGLGKTIQALVAAKEMGAKHALVICPAAVCENWRVEASVWAPGVNVAPISYDKLIRDKNVVGSDWDLVILDEAHYVKNRTAKRSKAALKVAAQAPRAFLLSGTPMPNHPAELWAPMHALWPDLLKEHNVYRYDDWFNTFCVWRMTQYGKKPFAVKNAPLLREIMGRVMLRRTIDKVALDLPPLRVTTSWLPYDKDFEKILTAAGYGPAWVAEQKARGVDASPPDSTLRRLVGEYKAPLIADQIAEELENRQYHKIVVLAYHRQVLGVLRERLYSFGASYVDGDTPAAQRVKEVEEFRHGTNRVFIGQQTATGTGMNLQVASEIVLAEPAWSPEDNAQAIKRIHRIGSEHPCRARVFIARGTADEHVLSANTSKLRMLVEVNLRGK